MSAFDTIDPQVAAMKDEVASREMGLKTKRGLFTIAGGILGVVGGAVIAPSLLPGAISELAPMMLGQGMVMGGTLGLAAGGLVGDYVTTIEKKKLAIDERILEASIHNKGYWQAYNTEVVQQNQIGQLPSPPVVGGPRPHLVHHRT